MGLVLRLLFFAGQKAHLDPVSEILGAPEGHYDVVTPLVVAHVAANVSPPLVRNEGGLEPGEITASRTRPAPGAEPHDRQRAAATCKARKESGRVGWDVVWGRSGGEGGGGGGGGGSVGWGAGRYQSWIFSSSQYVTREKFNIRNAASLSNVPFPNPPPPADPDSRPGAPVAAPSDGRGIWREGAEKESRSAATLNIAPGARRGHTIPQARRPMPPRRPPPSVLGQVWPGLEIRAKHCPFFVQNPGLSFARGRMEQRSGSDLRCARRC